MATKKIRTEELKQWAEFFPDYIMSDGDLLLRRSGSLVHGLLLEGGSNDTRYDPLFIMNNLLLPFGQITLGINQRMSRINISGNIVKKNIIYGRFKEEDAIEFKSQVELFQKPLTFELFFEHIIKMYKGECITQSGVPNLPATLSDIISVGYFSGDEEFYINSLPLAAKLLGKQQSAYHSYITPDEWLINMKNILEVDGDKTIESEIKVIGLPNLKDEGLPYKRIDNFLDILDEALSK